MKKIRILFFIDILMSGGKERRLTELMKALLTRDDIEFHLALMSRNIHYREVLDLGIPIHYLLRRSRRDLSVTGMLYRLCRELRPDILHCWDSMTAVYSFPVCSLLKIKLVNGMITNAPEHMGMMNKRWIRSRLSFPFSDVIIGNSRAGLMAYKAPEHKSFYIHNGFNFNRLGRIVPADEMRNKLNVHTRYVAGMVASYSAAKDYKTFFEAAQMILEKRDDITFLALGSHTASSSAHGHIRKVNSKFFRLLGPVSGIESYINSFDIGILSTFSEGISNSILEYMALGKPVIATRGGGTAEIVEDGVTGFLVERSDPSGLAGRIEMLLNDGELMSRMGNAGNERIISHFSIENMMNKYIKIYKCLLSGEKIKSIREVPGLLQPSIND